MAGLLSDFLRDAAAAPFAWGEHDCLLFLADWVEFCTRADPAADLRGRYKTEAEAGAMVANAGGHAALIERCLMRSGLDWWRCEAPAAGDIGLVNSRLGVLGAVCTAQGRWSSTTERGIARLTTPHILAWSVDGCRRL